ncbi:hypothetical protein Goshw_016257 [Gossypium schwendimanii]|uniref:Cytochrome P450 n=1 Tax=Gossypium schwendimanii TaxID=34291 RepID=A0A7J9LW58_GOSSC|nr:hypothetical protein [Gossypium schwendimanii]
MLSSSRIKDCHSSRSQAVDKLIDRLRAEAKANGGIGSVLKSACFIVFYIVLLWMCFGIEMDEETVEKMDPITKNVLITLDTRINDFLPILRPVIGEQRKRALQVRKQQVHAVVTNTTATVLEWGIAQLIHNPDIQSKLFDEIKTTGATTVGGFNIPIDPNLEIFFPGITEDPKIWSNPEKFNPADRFYLGKEDAHTTGVTMVKMKPFGAGTRICPGLTMATVHIHLILARMVQQIERTSYPPNSNIDFSGKFEFTVVMSNTLKARIKPMGGIR